MRNAISKFLGLDKIQTQVETLQKENANLRSLLVDANDNINVLTSDKHELSKRLDVYDNTDFQSIAKDVLDYADLAIEVDMYDLAGNLDNSDVASYIESDSIASYIDLSDLADYIDTESLIEHIDYGKLQDSMTDALDVDILAQTVSEKIADRDGMHQLISEEVENQGVGNISTDAVQSMIDSAIQQFADSLEVMVSAKLNINK